VRLDACDRKGPDLPADAGLLDACDRKRPDSPAMPDFWTLVIANDPEGKVMRRSAIASRLRV
jgi:hypothetical protein